MEVITIISCRNTILVTISREMCIPRICLATIVPRWNAITISIITVVAKRSIIIIASLSKLAAHTSGIIGTRCTGVRGFAGLVLSAASDSGTKTEHVGIVDPRIAPSEGHDEVWEHFGITSDAIVAAAKSLA